MHAVGAGQGAGVSPSKVSPESPRENRNEKRHAILMGGTHPEEETEASGHPGAEYGLFALGRREAPS